MARIKTDDIPKGTEELDDKEQKDVVGGASFGGRGRGRLGARMGRGGRPEARAGGGTSGFGGDDVGFATGGEGPPRP